MQALRKTHHRVFFLKPCIRNHRNIRHEPDRTILFGKDNVRAAWSRMGFRLICYAPDPAEREKQCQFPFKAKRGCVLPIQLMRQFHARGGRQRFLKIVQEALQRAPRKHGHSEIS